MHPPYSSSAAPPCGENGHFTCVKTLLDHKCKLLTLLYLFSGELSWACFLPLLFSGTAVVSAASWHAITCAFASFLQISDPRIVMTFPDHSRPTKAARLSSAKTSTATL